MHVKADDIQGASVFIGPHFSSKDGGGWEYSLLLLPIHMHSSIRRAVFFVLACRALHITDLLPSGKSQI